MRLSHQIFQYNISTHVQSLYKIWRPQIQYFCRYDIEKSGHFFWDTRYIYMVWLVHLISLQWCRLVLSIQFISWLVGLHININVARFKDTYWFFKDLSTKFVIYALCDSIDYLLKLINRVSFNLIKFAAIIQYIVELLLVCALVH